MTPASRTHATRLARGSSRRSLALLAATTASGVLHHGDHVLRADHSGWPFIAEVTPFTFSLLGYLVLLLAFLARSRPLLGAGALAPALIGTQAAHLLIETPADQYGVWATNASSDPGVLGQPNLLNIESPLLGVLAASLSILVSLMLLATIVSFVADARKMAMRTEQLRN